MRVSICIISLFNDLYKPQKLKKCKVIQQPSFTLGWPIGYFEGAAQEGYCGAGFVIKMISHEIIKGWMKAGCGTNSRAELMALWDLLYVAKKFGLKQSSIAGDSQMIIGWAKGESDFQALLLEHWKARFSKLISSFTNISF